MYYAFAIVKRVRAPLRALRAPRLSELAWRSRACSYAAVPTRACRYTCVSVYSLSPARKEEERERKRGEEEEGLLGRCSHRRKLLFSRLFFSPFFSLFSTLQLEQLEFEEAGKRSGVGSFGFRGDAGRICGLKPPYPRRRNTETSGIVEIFGW